MAKANFIPEETKTSSPAVCRDESEAEVIRSKYANDPDFTDLLRDFAVGLNERIKQMQEALEQGDFGQVKDLAHKLKGAAGFTGYPTLSETAKTLEHTAAKSSDIESVTLALNDLCSICRAVVRGVKQLQNGG